MTAPQSFVRTSRVVRSLSIHGSSCYEQGVINSGAAVQDVHAALNYSLAPTSLTLGLHALSRCDPQSPGIPSVSPSAGRRIGITERTPRRRADRSTTTYSASGVATPPPAAPLRPAHNPRPASPRVRGKFRTRPADASELQRSFPNAEYGWQGENNEGVILHACHPASGTPANTPSGHSPV
jgi:hypothetical protein